MSAIEHMSHATVAAICLIQWPAPFSQCQNSAEPVEGIKPLFCLYSLFTKMTRSWGEKWNKALRMEGMQQKTERLGEVDEHEPGFVAGTLCTITSCVSLQNSKCAVKYIWNAQTQPKGARTSSPKHVERSTSQKKSQTSTDRSKIQHLWPGLTFFLSNTLACVCVCGEEESGKWKTGWRETVLYSQALPLYKLKSVS